jgi:25S rRNA (cytosine2278-C5)-methyltransferase
VRWIRVNNLKASEKDAMIEFSNLKPVQSFKDIIPGTIYKDIHVPLLFGVHPSENIISTRAYKSGKIIIQDRASCFPVTILAPMPGDKLIDACAAPGNKTTHLASFVAHQKLGEKAGDNTPSINAFERDPKRGEILKKMIHTAGADSIVNVNIQDFTKSDPNEFADVVGMVVDPSCSGSGIFGRGFVEDENTDDNNSGATSNENLSMRLSKLAEFQYKIVLHAMSFPNVKTIVYSTCSIHAEENEQVVLRLLNDHTVRQRGWKLRPRERVLPLWERRGLENELDKESAQSCVRVQPIEDGGIGFFAACFERPVDGKLVSYHDESDNEEWTGFAD